MQFVRIGIPHILNVHCTITRHKKYSFSNKFGHCKLHAKNDEKTQRIDEQFVMRLIR